MNIASDWTGLIVVGLVFGLLAFARRFYPQRGRRRDGGLIDAGNGGGSDWGGHGSHGGHAGDGGGHGGDGGGGNGGGGNGGGGNGGGGD